LIAALRRMAEKKEHRLGFSFPPPPLDSIAFLTFP
jgi:hypothetical protein